MKLSKEDFYWVQAISIKGVDGVPGVGVSLCMAVSIIPQLRSVVLQNSPGLVWAMAPKFPSLTQIRYIDHPL